MATGRVLNTVKDSDLNVSAPLAGAAAVKGVRGKDSGMTTTTKGSSSGRETSVQVPSILNPVHSQASRGVGDQSSRGSSVTTIPFNSTLSHQPLGEKDWLRGNTVSTSTAYEAWREGTDRGKENQREDGGDARSNASNWNRDPLLEEDVFDIFHRKEERFAPEEVETLVSIITEKDNELTLSSASEDEDNREPQSEEETNGGQREQSDAENERRERHQHHLSSYPATRIETWKSSAGGDFPSARDACNVNTNEAPSSSRRFDAAAAAADDDDDEGTGTTSLFQLNGADLSSHMKGLLDRVVKLELEKERATKKLSEWAQCAHELQDLYTRQGNECRTKEALVAKLRRDLDKAGEGVAQLRATLGERDKVASELRQELVVKDQLLKESHENCNMLRSALVDAELELDRQEKVMALATGSSGAEEPNQLQLQSASEEIKKRMLGNLKADLVRKDQLLSKRNEKIMKQEFELERSKVQIYQQKQQIEMLTQELSRSRNQGEGAAATGGGDTAEEEKGKLIEELAHQIEEGSREIKIIQDELQAANPKIFDEES